MNQSQLVNDVFQQFLLLVNRFFDSIAAVRHCVELEKQHGCLPNHGVDVGVQQTVGSQKLPDGRDLRLAFCFHFHLFPFVLYSKNSFEKKHKYFYFSRDKMADSFWSYSVYHEMTKRSATPNQIFCLFIYYFFKIYKYK